MRKKNFLLAMVLCMALLFIFAVFSISFGAKQIAFSKVIDVILGKD